MELVSVDTVGQIEVRETHSGVVVLCADKAYKTKKPVVTDVLDFSTVDRRERACAREVLLNSRLAPAAYLGVGHFHDQSGRVAEPVIVMRRYPDSRRLAALLDSDTTAQREVGRIAELLAGFHYRSSHSRTVNSQATPDAIMSRWRENLDELRRYAGTVVQSDIIDQIDSAAMRYLAGRASLFAERISDSRVVDGHGDLLADDIFCMAEGPILLDCLDFDDQLRYIDGIDDAAFLAMDLEFLGRKDLADYFLDAYSYAAADHAPTSLRDFYISYRAVVRAKVDCMRWAQGDADAVSAARRHLSLALEHLTKGAVRLVMIGGPPGTGKTTLAHALADRVDAEVISTDEVRRELCRRGTIDGQPGILNAGLYQPKKVDAVYRDVLRRAKKHLAMGQSVILDGTWRDPRDRRLAEQLSTETASALLEIACWTSLDTAVERVKHRVSGPSQATDSIARELALRDDAWDTAHLIDTAQALPDCADQAEKLWHNAV